MGTTKNISLIVILICALLLQSCAVAQTPPMLDGQVLATHSGTAARIVLDAISGANGAFVMAKSYPNGATNYIFAKPFVDCWGFVLTGSDPAGLSPANVMGNMALTNPTFSDLMESAEKLGFSKVDKSTLPPWMTAMLKVAQDAYKNTVAVAQYGKLTIITIPISVFQPGDGLTIPGGPKAGD